MDKIRILVAEDSMTVRKYLVEVLARDPMLQVIAEAENGKQAIELCERERPDLVLMDMMMPVMTGLAATEYIMAYCPTPILIVSASLNRGELFKTYDALSAGAVTVIEKPAVGPNPKWEADLLATAKLVARIRVITHPRARLGIVSSSPPQDNGAAEGHSYRVVGIGGSTGGPGAMLQILSQLPADYPLPILLVLHVGTPFSVALAEWLDGQCALPVRCAEHGEPLPPVGSPGVLIASADRHLVVVGETVHLTDGPARHSCKPSVDVLFESLAADVGDRTFACLLTGMGRDGAAGLLAIRRSGGTTIAQDEATSTVYGMPKEARDIGAAERILGTDAIAKELRRVGGLIAQSRADRSR